MTKKQSHKETGTSRRDGCLDDEIARAKEQQLTYLEILVMYAIKDPATLQKVEQVFRIIRQMNVYSDSHPKESK